MKLPIILYLLIVCLNIFFVIIKLKRLNYTAKKRNPSLWLKKADDYHPPFYLFF